MPIKTNYTNIDIDGYRGEVAVVATLALLSEIFT